MSSREDLLAAHVRHPDILALHPRAGLRLSGLRTPCSHASAGPSEFLLGSPTPRRSGLLAPSSRLTSAVRSPAGQRLTRGDRRTARRLPVRGQGHPPGAVLSPAVALPPPAACDQQVVARPEVPTSTGPPRQVIKVTVPPVGEGQAPASDRRTADRPTQGHRRRTPTLRSIPVGFGSSAGWLAGRGRSVDAGRALPQGRDAPAINWSTGGFG